MARITLEALAFSYETTQTLLDGFDLEFESGRAHALLGPSGSGKSTLLNLLSGLLVPKQGRVAFDGRDVTQLPPASRNIAQVFQFPVLYPAMTVRENLEFPLLNRRVARTNASARIDAVAALLDLGNLLDASPRRLSAYNKQKVALARGLVRTDVAAVLLDEPLTAVEPAAKWRLRRALKDVQRELQLTMVYVTHDQLEALTFADRVTLLDAGRVIQTGTPEQLVDDPAHAFVGRFIGSPGMNFVPASLASTLAADPLDARLEIGFRPDDARVSRGRTSSGVAVRVTGTRSLGTRDGAEWGVLTATLGGVVLRTRQVLDMHEGDEGWLAVDDGCLRLFRNGVRVRDGVDA
jgi:glycerol transport system ATP-binding protein